MKSFIMFTNLYKKVSLYHRNKKRNLQNDLLLSFLLNKERITYTHKN